MRKFFICHAEGVTAIVSDDVYKDIKKYEEISLFFYKDDEKEGVKDSKRWRQSVANKHTVHLCVPVFTFTRQARFAQFPWFTGDDILLNVLVKHIQDNGGIVENERFHVPFSNGFELGMHGKEFMGPELLYVTTRQQFWETFGVRIEDLLQQ